MAPTYTLTAKLTRGKLHVRAWSQLAAALRSWRDGEYTIVIERKHAHRSRQMNALYWSVYVRALSDHTGYTSSEIHDILKAKFLPKPVAIADRHGEVVGEYVLGGSTTTLNIPEFSEFLDQIHAWAESLGVVIPDAEERVA